MRGILFDRPLRHSHSLKKQLAGAALTAKQQLALLALNYIPLAHIGVVASLAFLPPLRWGWRLLVASAALYLVPPLLARVLLALRPIRQGIIPAGAPPFFSWWASFQLQMIFARLPFLEEILRLVPGAYSQWLRLWGARVGRLTFWSPGTVILDRPFLSVGDNVVFGAGVRVNSHVLARNSSGQMELLLGTVKIGDRARVGGYSLLTAGAEIGADENPRALLVLPPFSCWKDGKRVRSQRDEIAEHYQ